MKLSPFRLHGPGSGGQASHLIADLGDDAAAFCGGTELLLAMKLGLASYEHLVDLKRADGLRGITADHGRVRIGAATTHHETETSAALRARYPERRAGSGRLCPAARWRSLPRLSPPPGHRPRPPGPR
jgi:aerobic carbon-monoxide dehydrogenase medium subunit